MRIALGADHAGFALKEEIREKLARNGHRVEDVGTFSPESCDYPDYAFAVASRVSGGQAERGILVCSSGIGMSIAANKVAGVRAAAAASVEQARLSRGHNDANVLALGARFLEPATAVEMVDAFLATAFEGGRHARRVDKISQRERNPSA
ncbi:MAG: ribose 5-phosphate isomerase B [Bryobacterales bacterium]|nr:ribose 5-phosphate isomerase B [Bryobacterales bacterium]